MNVAKVESLVSFSPSDCNPLDLRCLRPRARRFSVGVVRGCRTHPAGRYGSPDRPTRLRLHESCRRDLGSSADGPAATRRVRRSERERWRGESEQSARRGRARSGRQMVRDLIRSRWRSPAREIFNAGSVGPPTSSPPVPSLLLFISGLLRAQGRRCPSPSQWAPFPFGPGPCRYAQ